MAGEVPGAAVRTGVVSQEYRAGELKKGSKGMLLSDCLVGDAEPDD